MLKEEKIWHPRLGLASQGDKKKMKQKSRGGPWGVRTEDKKRKEKRRNA
jgi:hypothetical protein